MNLFPSPGLFAAFVAASVLLALTPGPDMALYPVAHLRRRPLARLRRARSAR